MVDWNIKRRRGHRFRCRVRHQWYINPMRMSNCRRSRHFSTSRMMSWGVHFRMTSAAFGPVNFRIKSLTPDPYTPLFFDETSFASRLTSFAF